LGVEKGLVQMVTLAIGKMKVKPLAVFVRRKAGD